MKFIISLIIIISPNQYYLKNVKIYKPCDIWYTENVYYDSKYNNHYIGKEITMGYICNEEKSGK